MGQIRKPAPVLLFVAVFSSVDGAFHWAKRRLEAEFGAVEMESDTFATEDFTDYYARDMGEKLPKKLWAFHDLIDPAELSRIKVLTNALEEEFQDLQVNSPVRRALNLDPGYVDLGKLVLASTKDHAHRVYLSQGIFAETTLHYTQKNWKSLPWTYPDYQTAAYQAFLTQCRDYLTSLRSRRVGEAE